jgi:signal transduction histidine kinase
VRVTFSAAARGTLAICDDGAAIPRTIARQLFDAPVTSRTGYGVGLYQSGRLAQQNGYRLLIDANEPGKVCFSLSAAPASTAQVEREVA